LKYWEGGRKPTRLFLSTLLQKVKVEELRTRFSVKKEDQERPQRREDKCGRIGKTENITSRREVRFPLTSGSPRRGKQKMSYDTYSGTAERVMVEKRSKSYGEKKKRPSGS